MANTQNIKNENDTNTEEVPETKEVISTEIIGTVKWFNVKRGYGFVCRKDNQEDVFIHQSAILKSNPDHPRKSVGENEEIMFDIVKGAKGNEAANVTAADGSNVKGSDYALRYPRGRGRGGYRGKRGGRGRPRVVSGSSDKGPQDFPQGVSQRRPRGGRPYVVQYRRPQPQYDFDYPMYYYGDYYRGGMRGGRGGPMMRGGRGGMRGGLPPPGRDMQMPWPPMGPGRPPRRGGRGRGRGGRGRGGRGRGGMNQDRDESKERQHEEEHDDAN